jgi:hypothetical protein
VPVGHVAWAVLLPGDLRVVDSEGNMKEVPSFTLPFRHFADARHARHVEQKAMARELARAMDKLEALKQASLAEQAKARGVLPVRVEIPIAGQISRFEKLLVVDEAVEMTLTYRRKSR